MEDLSMYDPEVCDGDFCPKDCESCPKRELPRMFIKYEGNKPVAYAYGEPWVAMALYMDDMGYKTPEEARAAWERMKDDV